MDHNHPIVKNLMSDMKEIVPDLIKGPKIESADLFDAIGGRHSFFEHADIWEHLGEIITAIKKNGGKIDGKDFTKVVINTKSPLDFAIEKGTESRIFTPEIWEGQQAEMERAWFRVPRDKRDADFFMQLRRDIAAAEGRELREDVLDSMGISVQMVRNAIRDGEYESLQKKLAKHNDYLRACDVILLDTYGDHTLDSSASWRNFGKLQAELAAHGEFMTVDDFLMKHHDRKSPLEWALSESALKQIFTVQMWRDRLSDMMTLLEHVPSDRRGSLNIDEVVREIQEESYGKRIPFGPELRKGMLTNVMNDAAGTETPIRGLGLKKTWDLIAMVRDTLKKNGEAITLEDLRLTSGNRNETVMAAAARFGRFDAVLDILTERGETLSVADLCRKSKNEESILDLLVRQKKLGTILKPELWVDRREEFKVLWSELPDQAQEDIGYQDFISQMNFIALRRRFGGQSPAP
jgi:hypothetical protein